MSSPTKSLGPTNDLPAQLKQIGLKTIPAKLDDFLTRATKAHWFPRLLLEQLAQEENQERSRRSLERRLRRSGIKKFKVMADFEWSWPKKIERDVIEQALTLGFIREARNFVLIGPNGLGKTMIAKNVCHLAVLAGYSVLFRTAAAIVEDLRHEMFEGRRRKLRGYGKVDLLCIDECAYLSFDDKAADILYEVINRRYESKSVILTTNRSFKEFSVTVTVQACHVGVVQQAIQQGGNTAPWLTSNL
jgi:DNA replication protein DnaC